MRYILAALMFLAAACGALAQAGKPSPRSLWAAAATGDVAAIRAALAAGVSVDVRDARGRTALLVATHANKVAAAKVLIAAGANVNAKDAIEDTPFLYAGAEGRTEILKLALKAGADLTDTNRYGGTALIPAAHYGHVENVRVLLGTKIDIDHVNKLGWTALLEAIILGDGGKAHTKIVELLLRAGARTNIADRQGMTPLAHARKRGQSAIVALLTKAGAR